MGSPAPSRGRLDQRHDGIAHRLREARPGVVDGGGLILEGVHEALSESPAAVELTGRTLATVDDEPRMKRTRGVTGGETVRMRR
jgi:hypothetical protein